VFFQVHRECEPISKAKLSPPGGFVSPSGGFASILIDQAVPKTHSAN